jgi:cellulose synthase/poly-beta-1,6-N-acetylglucosamine synthase-like glycosyltransferase
MIEEYPQVSIIIPVKNEALLLNKCLHSLMKLDYPKDRLEIIIADGKSQDNTKEVALGFGAKVVTNEKQIVVSGRNRGFLVASGEIIVFTDADCIFDPHWLRNAIEYFNDSSVGGVGGVTLAPEDGTDFEKAVDFIFHLAELFGSTSHRRDASLIKEVNDIPGCNAMYRKAALDKVMPVDEGLLTAEDAWMNFCLKKNGYKLILASDVKLWHYRRNSPKRFLRQMYRFAIGRLQVGKKQSELLNGLHISIGLSLPVFLLLGIVFYLLKATGLFFDIVIAFFVVAIVSAYLIKSRSLSVILNIPLVMVLFITGWSAGFLRELLCPLKNAEGK